MIELDSRIADPTSDHAPINIRDLIDSRAISGMQIGLIVFCCVAGMLEGYDLQAMAIAVPVIATEWRVGTQYFGSVLSALIFGMAVGGVALSPLGDSYGRKPLIVGSLVIIGVSSLATLACGDLWQLFFCRFITGVGIGGCAPGIYALTADFIPSRGRSFAMTTLACSTSLGAAMGAMVAPVLITHLGWQGIFLVGGILPLIYAGVLAVWLPESMQILLARRPGSQALARSLKRMAIFVPQDQLRVSVTPKTRVAVVAFLTHPYGNRTIVLWSVWTISSFIVYGLANWIPTLFVRAGLSQEDAIRCSSFLWAGGLVGGLLLSWTLDHVRRKAMVLSVVVFATIIPFALFSVLPPEKLSWSLLLIWTGAGLVGVQFVLPSICGLLYPSGILAGGIGWGVSIARIGAVAASLFGGVAIGSNIASATLLTLMILPTGLMGIGLLAFFRFGSQDDAALKGRAPEAELPMT